MGAFDELRKEEPSAKPVARPIIKARKKLKKQYVMGCISNGDALIRLDNEYAIKTVALDGNFVELILVDYGKEQEMPKQGWQKTKEVVKVPKIKIDDSEEASSLF